MAQNFWCIWVIMNLYVRHCIVILWQSLWFRLHCTVPSMGSCVSHKFCERWTPGSLSPLGWWAPLWLAWPGRWWRTRPRPPPWCRPTGSEGHRTDLDWKYFNPRQAHQMYPYPAPSAPRKNRWTQSQTSPGCRPSTYLSTQRESKTPNQASHCMWTISCFSNAVVK